jgi:hypothetical protein
MAWQYHGYDDAAIESRPRWGSFAESLLNSTTILSLDIGPAFRHFNKWSDHFQGEPPMDVNERESTTEIESIGLPALWYEKMFRIQMLFLLTAMSIGLPLIFMRAIFRLPQPPWWGMAFIVSMSIIVPLAFGRLAVNSCRHVLWMFGRAPHVESWIGPPNRINCVIMGLLPVALFDIGINAGWPAGAIPFVIAGFLSFFSITGFLYAQAEARKSC